MAIQNANANFLASKHIACYASSNWAIISFRLTLGQLILV
jgi:hypothetical protein